MYKYDLNKKQKLQNRDKLVYYKFQIRSNGALRS